MKYKLMAFIDIIILFALIIGIPLYMILIHPEIWHNFRSIDAFESFMDRHQEQSIPIYVGCQIVQVIVTILPGQVVQIAGGYFYGFLPALVLSLTGIIIGSTVSFFLARKIGKRPMELIFGEQKFNKYREMLNTKKAHKIIFLLYLIPGLPKDMVAYAAGVSKMRFTVFIVLSIVGRFPAMAASLLMGAMLDSESYTGVIILAAAVAVVFIVCIIKKDAILSITDKYYDRLNG
jgi:uncharacterized membrane protein YdjX (TVP38/TMEM64 family)